MVNVLNIRFELNGISYYCQAGDSSAIQGLLSHADVKIAEMNRRLLGIHQPGPKDVCAAGESLLRACSVVGRLPCCT